MVQQSNATVEQEVGYGCSCGFKTPNKKEFTQHVMFSARQDGKGTHKSIGRMNLKTGEIVARPWAERSSEEKRRTRHRAAPSDDGGGDGSGGGGKVQTTSIVAEAQQIRLVPKIFTMDYSPILRAAQDAATKFFNWRPDMPLENFIDTCLYLFFEEKGITLCGYIVNEALLKKEEQHGG